MPTFEISTPESLYNTLAQVSGGDTIVLQGGFYGEISLTEKSDFDVTFPENVTIVSADPDNPAVFSSLVLRNANNLSFDGIVFDYQYQEGDEHFTRPFQIKNSENITIRNSTFDGERVEGVSDTADGHGYGMGLVIADSTHITIENNEFFEFHRGILTGRSADIVIANNDIHSIRSDGLNFSQVDGVRILNNYLHDFDKAEGSGDHADMIQFWTNGTTQPSKDIMISGNHLDIGAGDDTQSIFMRNDMVDRGLAGFEMYYQDVTITNNVIVNGHLHGITVGEANNLVISNNSVLHSDGGHPDGSDSSVEIPQIKVASASTNVEISHNITANIAGWDGQASWSVFSNAIVQDQDRMAPGYYGDVFVGSSLQLQNESHQFVALPDGMLQQMQAGATPTLTPVQVDAVAASFHIEAEVGNPALRFFDASMARFGTEAPPEGTVYEWDFGDGTTAVGQRVAHTFSTGGEYDVRLNIRLPDGQSDSIQTALGIAGPDLLSMRADGHFTSFNEGQETAINVGGAASASGLQLGATGITAAVERDHVERLLQSDEFQIDMTLTANHSGASGEVFRLHGTIIAEVQEGGELHLTLTQAEGDSIRLTTSGASLSDGQTHNVSVQLLDGELSLLVDGQPRASASNVGMPASSGSQALVFGNPWGKDNFDGTLSAFHISTDRSDYAEGAPTQPLPPVEAPVIDPTATPVVEASAETAPPQILPLAELTSTLPEFESIIDIGGKGVAARIEREDVNFLPGTEEFNIDLTLMADQIGTEGEVFRMHHSLLVKVDRDGNVSLYAFSDDGLTSHLVSSGVDVSDGRPHDISIGLSGGILSLSVDNAAPQLVARSEPLGGLGRHDLVFGNPWGKDNFDGKINAFKIVTPPNPELGETNAHSFTLTQPEIRNGMDLLWDQTNPIGLHADKNGWVSSNIWDADGMYTKDASEEVYVPDISFFYSV